MDMYKKEWVAGAYEASWQSVDLSTIAEVQITHGGGDDVSPASPQQLDFTQLTGNPRWAVGTKILVWARDATDSSHDLPVFNGQITEATWENTTGYTRFKAVGIEFKFFRRTDALAAAGTCGPNSTIVDLAAAAGWSVDPSFTFMTAAEHGTLNRPAQGSAMNGAWVQQALAGTFQNMVIWHTNTGGLGTAGYVLAPDRIKHSDYYTPISIDARYCKVTNAGWSSRSFFRKCRVDGVGAVTDTYTIAGISSTRLEETTRFWTTWHKTNADAAVCSQNNGRRQGSDLTTHRIYSLELWPDAYQAATGGTTGWVANIFAPGDLFNFDNIPTLTNKNRMVWNWAYATPAGVDASDVDWDVRTVVRTWDPIGGWKLTWALTPRTWDGT
jgi:hypothetical protein